MPRFSVAVTVDATVYVEVEADSEEEAKEKALGTVDVPTLCHHCSREIDIGDAVDTPYIREIESQ